MTYGDGETFKSVTALDVVAHEVAHGLCHSPANLEYEGESGGLNEASSDIFGAMVQLYGHVAHGEGSQLPAKGARWTIGEDLKTPAFPTPLRYMYKPSLDGFSPDAWSPDLDYMDVHFSSGPMNRAFYYMSQGASAALAAPSYSNYLPAGMPGIGNDAAARIWYRALTVYLTPSSNYKQARTAALRAAQDLFPPDASGNASAQTIAVRKAFGAINVGDPYATVDDLTNPSVVPSLTPAAATPSGTPLPLSATVTGTYGVNEVDYFVDTILVAAAFNPPNFNVQLDAAHLLANTTANGPHYLTAAAYAPSGNAGVSSPPGVAFTTSNPVQQILVDPGFEGGGMTGWQGDTSLAVQTDYTGTIAHSGYRYARFDRSAGEQSLTLSQQVTIPAGTTSAVLSLWSQVQGNPALNAADTLQIQIQSGQGSAPVVLDTLTTQQIRGDWTRSSYDLSAYQGQVTLSLVSSVGVNTGTAFLVDDLALTCSAVPQVQVQVSLNPAVFGPQPLTVDTFSRAPIGPLYAQVTGGPGSTAVAWSVLEGATGGTLSPGPTPSYTPPWLYGFFHVVATSVADPTVSAQASMHWLNALTLLPAAATLETGASLPFQVVAASFINPVFSVTGGSVAQTGPGTVTYTAPAAPGTYTLTATSLNYQSSATLTVIAPLQVTITPASLTMVAGSSVPLSATVIGSGNTDVAWTIQEGAVGGIITNSGDDSPPVYTASGIIGTYHLVATCVADPTRSAVLTITVQAGGIAINPASATVITGGTVGFQAFATLNQPVTWSLPAGGTAGAIDSFGNYTAPAAPGSYLVQAATAGGLSSSATVQVLTTNFSGDGKPFMNSADLAILADAWGSTPGSANWNPAVDLNGDGVINDLDVTLFFTQFGGF